MSYSAEKLTEQDRDVLSVQISRIPENPRIIKRCVYGYPSIIIIDSMDSDSDINKESDKSLFESFQAVSDVLWLTCPYLNEKIHYIESNGYIKKIQDYIFSDRRSKSMMNSAHAHFYYLRKNIFGIKIKKNRIDELKKIAGFGIGGMEKFHSIKCLHMHYAHYIFCDKNIAGMMTAMLLKKNISCDSARCGSKSHEN
jgi:hypothetical protein